MVIEDYLTIGNKKIPVKRTQIEQNLLKYYPENPRIYSIVYDGDSDPSQQEIEEKLQRMDHVKYLKQSIKANGGLIDPIIVKDVDYVVLEGNSRLAAYRLLIREDVIKWGKISAILLPDTIDNNSIFALLGQYHIIGRKDWIPFEQAGYLWRRKNNYGVNETDIATEVGMTVGEVKKLIDVYDFMKEHNDVDAQHWSYYEEYLKSRYIKKYRDKINIFDERIVEMIKTGQINAAIDIREKLQAIAKMPAKKGEKVMEALVDGSKSFDECYEIAEVSGVNVAWYRLLYSFRIKIAVPEAKRMIKKLDKAQQDKCIYEFNKIEDAIRKIRDHLTTN